MFLIIIKNAITKNVANTKKIVNTKKFVIAIKLANAIKIVNAIKFWAGKSNQRQTKHIDTKQPKEGEKLIQLN